MNHRTQWAHLELKPSVRVMSLRSFGIKIFMQNSLDIHINRVVQCAWFAQTTCNCMLNPFHATRNVMNSKFLPFFEAVWAALSLRVFHRQPRGIVLNWKRRGEQEVGRECTRGYSTSPSTSQVHDKCQAQERPCSEMKIAVDYPKCHLVCVVKGAHGQSSWIIIGWNLSQYVPWDGKMKL